MTSGTIVGVNGNMLTVKFDGAVSQNEVGYALLDDMRLMSEIVRIRGDLADMQVFEDTSGLQIGDVLEFSGNMLSVELAPGLLTQIYDGLQNPLPRLAEQCGFFLQRGTYLDPIPRDTKWTFTPKTKIGDSVTAGEALGSTQEGIFEHYIMVPFSFAGKYTVASIADGGDFTVTETIATLKDEAGNTHDVAMLQRWPVKVPIEA